MICPPWRAWRSLREQKWRLPVTGGVLSTGLVAILPYDGDEDQQKGQQAHCVDERVAFVRPLHEQERDAVESLDGEGRGEGEEQGIVRTAPEFQEVQPRGQRG